MSDREELIQRAKDEAERFLRDDMHWEHYILPRLECGAPVRIEIEIAAANPEVAKALVESYAREQGKDLA